MSTVALPIETKVREFHGKLWLALNLLERDHNVILGPSWEVDTTIHKTKPDAYISKDVSDGNVSYCEDLREAGIRVYGLPTEGGIGASGESWSSTRSQIVDHLDGFLCWGTAHKNALSTHYDATDSLYVTGNPRFDLQYDRVRSIYGPKAMSLGEEYGPFILFNTNFGRANPFDRKLRHNTLERVFGEVDEETIRHDSRVFHAFVEGILYLSSELEDLDIIVRPHPGEHHGTYRQIFSQYEDIYVQHSGDVRAWIEAARVVVHHDCTTGIESVLMGCPTVSYRPLDTESDHSEISQAISVETFTREQFVDAVERLASVQQYDLSKYQKDRLRPYFNNVDVCAATAICDVIEDHGPIEDKNYTRVEPTTWRTFEAYVKATPLAGPAAQAYDAVRWIRGTSSMKTMREKARQKFPGLDAEEIRATLHLMDEETASRVTIEQVFPSRDTFFIREKESQ